MADNYNKLRAALKAGPTPGPWKALCIRGATDVHVGPESGYKSSIITWPGFENHLSKGQNDKNARYIAAAHPETIRSLMEERDALIEQHHRDSRTLSEYAKERDEARSRASQAMHTAAGEEACARKARFERDALLAALVTAEAALADIGDADREPGDDLEWCERRAAEALPKVRAAIDAARAAGSE